MVSFINCKSKEWKSIGEVLASMPELAEIAVRDCDSGDELCAGVCASKSLRQLRMGTSAEVTQRTALSPTGECRVCSHYASCGSFAWAPPKKARQPTPSPSKVSNK